MVYLHTFKVSPHYILINYKEYNFRVEISGKHYHNQVIKVNTALLLQWSCQKCIT